MSSKVYGRTPHGQEDSNVTDRAGQWLAKERHTPAQVQGVFKKLIFVDLKASSMNPIRVKLTPQCGHLLCTRPQIAHAHPVQAVKVSNVERRKVICPCQRPLWAKRCEVCEMVDRTENPDLMTSGHRRRL